MTYVSISSVMVVRECSSLVWIQLYNHSIWHQTVFSRVAKSRYICDSLAICQKFTHTKVWLHVSRLAHSAGISCCSVVVWHCCVLSVGQQTPSWPHRIAGKLQLYHFSWRQALKTHLTWYIFLNAIQLAKIETLEDFVKVCVAKIGICTLSGHGEGLRRIYVKCNIQAIFWSQSTLRQEISRMKGRDHVLMMSVEISNIFCRANIHRKNLEGAWDVFEGTPGSHKIIGDSKNSDNWACLVSTSPAPLGGETSFWPCSHTLTLLFVVLFYCHLSLELCCPAAYKKTFALRLKVLEASCYLAILKAVQTAILKAVQTEHKEEPIHDWICQIVVAFQ